MASDEKLFNMKVMCLVEENAFALWIISIQGQMQPLSFIYDRHERNNGLLENWLGRLQAYLS